MPGFISEVGRVVNLVSRMISGTILSIDTVPVVQAAATAMAAMTTKLSSRNHKSLTRHSFPRCFHIGCEVHRYSTSVEVLMGVSHFCLKCVSNFGGPTFSRSAIGMN